MDHAELVELITAEVLRQLKSQAGSTPPTAKVSFFKALAIMTGGTTGLGTALEQLKVIQGLAVDLTVVLSAAAERVIGLELTKTKLGDQIKIVYSDSPYPEEAFQQADVVLVPILTRNTAAKLAHVMCDTMTSRLLYKALAVGKPVIAATDAAEPHGTVAPALQATCRAHLQTIESYGVRLTGIANLAAITKQVLMGRSSIGELGPRLQSNSEHSAPKQVLDAEAVKAAQRTGAKSIVITRGTIVTPLAYDVARDFNMEIVRT